MTGLDTIHEMTNDGRTYELRIDLQRTDFSNQDYSSRYHGYSPWNPHPNRTEKGYALYSNFSISNSSDNYRLHVGAFLGGNAGTIKNFD